MTAGEQPGRDTSVPRPGARPSLFTGRYAGWLDRAMVLAVLLLSMPWSARHHEGFTGAPSIVALALIVPLLWRRRSPMLVFSILAAVAFVQWLTFRPTFADVALLVALYTVASREPRRWPVAVAGAVLEFGILLVVLQDRGLPSHGLPALVMLSGLLTAAVVLGLNVRMRGAYLQAVEDRAQRLERERDQQSELAAAAERTRIARDLHDIVAHNLSVMIALADGAALSMDSHPQEARHALTEAASAGRRAMGDLRQVLGVLRDQDDPQLAPTPGLNDLDDLVRAARDAGLRVETSYRGDMSELPAPLQLSLFRIVQESLTNAIKHAHDVRRVQVDLRVDDSAAEVVVSDDGRPDTAPAAPRGFGHGLTGMQERAALHGGTLLAGVTPLGWTVRARLPLPAAGPTA